MRAGVKQKVPLEPFGTSICALIISVLCVQAAHQSLPCDKSRKVYSNSWGVITHGPSGSNYTQDSHCEWLIKANSSNQFITLNFKTMGTECSYDYIFVYDGDSFQSTLLGSFSGKTEPQQITASSGAMLILLYSDANYVLDGFRAEYSITDCPNNCTKHGVCVGHMCVCEADWRGKDCSKELCPDECGSKRHRGRCDHGKGCSCHPQYSGEACSLDKADSKGNKWHWLSRAESGFSARAAHTAVYYNETDSLYVFGGYDLNKVLGDLVIYNFKSSHWEDEYGNMIDGTSTLKLLSPQQLKEVVHAGKEELWALQQRNSFLGNILLAISENSTIISHPQPPREISRYRARLGRDLRHLLRLEREASDASLDNDDNENKEIDNIRTANIYGDQDGILTSVTEEQPLHKISGFEEYVVTDAHSHAQKSHFPVKPSARYGHAACGYPGGFVLFGGKLATGELSNELWYYNVKQRNWSLRASDSRITPPKLTRHTLTHDTKQNYIYLFGGSTENGEFSSKLFSIKLNFDNPEDEQWSEIHARGGKELDVRMVAHTTVYHSHTNSLLVYGGIVVGVARFSKLSDRMFSFQLDSRHWSEVHYPRAHLRDTYVPRERAFHTSTIIGNYLIVFGGYSHRHNKEEICYDSHMYLYHLGCHTWVSHDIVGVGDKAQDFRCPKQQGVFAHAADVRNGNTLLIVGGYHGNVNADLLAYVLPPVLASREGETYEAEQVCGRHRSFMECTANPECGWCSADEVCYGRTIGINCTTNLQTTRCPGICPALGDCHSCLIHGTVTTPTDQTPNNQYLSAAPLSSVASKLNLGQCTWCVQNARCHHKDDNFGVCGLREDTPSQVPGWWGPKGTEIKKVEECRELDRRPGLTFLKYKHPANWSQPDSVTIINATTVDFNMVATNTLMEKNLDGEIIARLLGFLRPPDVWGDGKETLRMCASYSSAILRMSHGNVSSEDMLDVVGNLTADASQCVTAQWQNGTPAVLYPGRYLVDFESRNNVSNGPHQQSKMELLHNKSQENAKVFTFDYLEPYENGSCHLYTNCLHCLEDSLCGWCDLNQRCMSRKSNESEECVSPELPNEWRYLTLLPSSCANCSNYISCESCVSSGLCEWWTEDARCARKGRSQDAVVQLSECPVPCHLRRNCSQCLDDRGRCVWCETKQECFSFSIYTSEYQFGQCREWVDQVYVLSPNPLGRGRHVGLQSNNQCKSCKRHTNCTSCLQSLGCGWCYSQENPILGVCVEGDFSHPHTDSCSAAVNFYHNTTLDLNGTRWSYAMCPDVDECDLGLDDCHPNAECTNTHGSYTCKCKQGFIGDGIHTCVKTCDSDCIHGYCGGPPDYICKCELGWTGEDCGINCGCNNHSTCLEGVGKCDSCHDWTEGEFCQFCRPGSFGNATSSGCQLCNCNEHGNYSKGICDRQTGECFCKDNTEGQNCERCKKGYYGDPRHGGMCYYECASRGMLSGLESQGLGSRLGQLNPWEKRQRTIPIHECLWIVSPFDVQNKSVTPHTSQSSVVQFTIHDDINVSCQENSIYVYDGLPDFMSPSGNHQNHVLGVFCSADTEYPVTVEAKSGILTVYYKQADLSEGFNASYTVMTCEKDCGGNHTCHNDQCVCKDGWTGSNCSIVMCPRNCSANKSQGVCDKAYGQCVCSANFGGEDCSVQLNNTQLVFTQLFDTNRISDSLEHLRKTIPRFGHSVVADRRGSLWMFGGYSLSNGPLNDIRLFDTRNNTWIPVTVDSTRDVNMPQGRYFHAAEIVHTTQDIYVYGGLAEKEHVTGLSRNVLNDFWKFSLKNQRWTDIKNEKSPPPLAGHTLTLHRGLSSESENLVLIGGFNPKYGFMDVVWEYDIGSNTWNKLNTSGSGPIGVFGHSTVYHNPTESFYVFGGYIFDFNSTYLSNKLFSFHYPSQKWSVLPTFEGYNPASDLLPRARFLHSAITTDDYMIVFGGRTNPHNTTDSLMAYSYICNYWIRLLAKDIHIVGTPPPATYAHGMTYDPENGAAYVIGGFDGGVQSLVIKIVFPRDLCNLWTSKDRCITSVGCSYCEVAHKYGETTSLCYSNSQPLADSCESSNGTVKTNNGVVCNPEWFSRRTCEQYRSCTDCLAKWPSYATEMKVCGWCADCNSPKCGAVQDFEDKDTKERITDVERCPEKMCPASDCEKCLDTGSCIWTRQVQQHSDDFRALVNQEPIFNWSCVPDSIPKMSSLKIKSAPPASCPSRCSEYKDCQSCLNTTGSEGGWHECRWSVQLNECISPSYQPLYCAGGVCGLVLRGDDIDQCPEQCSSFTQCSTCLKHAHCGWCALSMSNVTGLGVCTEGSFDSPSDRPSQETCRALYYKQQAEISEHFGLNSSSVILANKNISDCSEDDTDCPTFSWHYVKCPPENECLNNHHTCDNKSEICVDALEGFTCICGPGYKEERSTCVPVCSKGCVRGVCVEPNVCRCDFGYVGSNCSIQCQCNGHSNCAGPDRLDECIECHNNTQGRQCQKCRPLYVGDPTNNGQCMPCSEFCNGHADICVDVNMATKAFRPENELRYLLEQIHEGPSGLAKCINCANNTRGDRCDECIYGYFRGSTDASVACRECECHGHGDTCNPVTGEKCNCQDNTESDLSNCISNLGKTSTSQQGQPPPCWTQQCTKCKESYMGTPKDGHQCYKHMLADSQFCFDAKQVVSHFVEECRMKPHPLKPGKVSFFAIQPKFLNVDIRVIVDVTQGALDFFLSASEKTFIVRNISGEQRVDLDSLFQYSLVDTTDNAATEIRMLDDPLPVYTAEVIRNNLWRKHKLLILEALPESLTTYITVTEKNTILIVRNVHNRLVLTLPQDSHELNMTKFYMALVASTSGNNTSNVAYGTIFFRQDQLHIDLFVFFSVFFSCFFLFLAACVVAWKAKQAADLRRDRHRHAVEMLHMAKRPFASVTLLLDSLNDDSDHLQMLPSPSTAQSPLRKKLRKQPPISVGDVRPVAVEPTDDGVAAVGTLFVQLPGGSDAPVRLALASSLILLARVYPLNGRAFLRRRSSHAPT